MCESFTFEYNGVSYTVTPNKRTLLLDVLTDEPFYPGSDLDDPDHIYSALKTTELGEMPLCDLLVGTVNGKPPKEIDNVLTWIVGVETLRRFYADTDLAENLRKSAVVFQIMRPACDAVIQKIKDGILSVEKELTVGSHNEALQREARKMPNVMQQLQALGDDCPEWAKDDE